MSNVKILDEGVDLDVWLKENELHIVVGRSCEGYSAKFEEIIAGNENIVSNTLSEAVRSFLTSIRGTKIFVKSGNSMYNISLTRTLFVPSFSSESIIKAMDEAEHI